MQEKIIRSVSETNSGLKLKKCNVLRIDEDRAAARTYSRKDFYKICLTTGKSAIHYTDRSFEVEGTVLFFGNPDVPYSWEILSSTLVGYSCLFSADFLMISERDCMLQQSPFFRTGGNPVLNITDEQRIFLNVLFEKMIEEQGS
jgi:AraC family transcriptional regulator, transcriptional activator of pobA